MTSYLKPLPILADGSPPDDSNSDIDAIHSLREHQTRRLLQVAGLRLQKAPPHLGDGYRIYSGNQVLAPGRGLLSLDDVIEHSRRAGLFR
jgi:hypothetical protein